MQSPVLWRIVRVVALSLPILAVFALTVLLVAGVMGWMTGNDVFAGWNLYVSTVCSLLAWLIIAAFHFKRETMTFPVQDRQSFSEGLKAQLQALGYDITSQTDDWLVSTPSFQSLLVGSGIQARIDDDSARVSGPKFFLELLRRRLRLQNHMQNVQRTFLDAKRREGEHLLKRVQISLRVPGDQWQEVYRKIIAVLAREEAQVHCDINVLAQSETGIRASMVDLGIRDWLRRQDIKADVHVEPLHFGEGEAPKSEAVAPAANHQQQPVPADKIEQPR